MKIALVAFNGESVCFAHVLLNAIDMAQKGDHVRVIIEGNATKQIAELIDPDQPFASLYDKVRKLGLITAVCKACAAKTGALEAAEEQGLPIIGAMSGHPPLREHAAEGYQIITF